MKKAILIIKLIKIYINKKKASDTTTGETKISPNTNAINMR